MSADPSSHVAISVALAAVASLCVISLAVIGLRIAAWKAMPWRRTPALQLLCAAAGSAVLRLIYFILCLTAVGVPELTDDNPWAVILGDISGSWAYSAMSDVPVLGAWICTAVLFHNWGQALAHVNGSQTDSRGSHSKAPDHTGLLLLLTGGVFCSQVVSWIIMAVGAASRQQAALVAAVGHLGALLVAGSSLVWLLRRTRYALARAPLTIVWRNQHRQHISRIAVVLSTSMAARLVISSLAAAYADAWTTTATGCAVIVALYFALLEVLPWLALTLWVPRRPLPTPSMASLRTPKLGLPDPLDDFSTPADQLVEAVLRAEFLQSNSAYESFRGGPRQRTASDAVPYRRAQPDPFQELTPLQLQLLAATRGRTWEEPAAPATPVILATAMPSGLGAVLPHATREPMVHASGRIQLQWHDELLPAGTAARLPGSGPPRTRYSCWERLQWSLPGAERHHGQVNERTPLRPGASSYTRDAVPAGNKSMDALLRSPSGSIQRSPASPIPVPIRRTSPSSTPGLAGTYYHRPGSARSAGLSLKPIVTLPTPPS